MNPDEPPFEIPDTYIIDGRNKPREIPKLNEKEKARFLKKINFNGPLLQTMKTQCWDWTGSKNKEGYGRFAINKSKFFAHRITFNLFGGVFKENQQYALHHCDRPSCCRPSHIFAGTLTENNEDRDKKGRHRPAYGDLNGSRKKPECLARGEKHGSKTKPECCPRGDRNGSRTKPECLARGTKNGKFTKPERTPRGEKAGQAKLTKIQVLEIIHRREKENISYSQIAKEYGISKSQAGRLVKRQSWVHL